MTLEQAALATAPETSLDQTEIASPSIVSPAPAAVLRTRLSLDGEWQFAFCGDTFAPLAEVADWRTCTVPAPWQAQFADLRERNGRAWYRRTFELPAGWIPSAAALVLRFGAVNYHARVWVNGSLAVEHEGGYLPFEAEIGALVRPGRNEVVVAVTAPTDDRQLYPDLPVGEVPFGKQSWYGPLGGIWQSVHLERRAADHLRAVRLTPCLRTGRVDVAVELSHRLMQPCELELKVTDPDGIVVASTTVVAAAGQDRATAALFVLGPLPWSPEAPRLYRITATLRRGGEVLDVLPEIFGFRTVEARDGRIYLNGEPVYLRGALDQDYYPDGICTTPSEAFLEDQFRKAKALGLNCVRCHIKVPDPRYYAVADRVGLLVWTELPNVGRLTDQAAERLRATMEGILERDGSHPSIVCWTIINENWGTDLVHDAEHRAWLNRTHRWLKALDPTRLVVDNSACPPNFHVESDLDDFHFYAALPDHRPAWDGFAASFADRCPGSFSPHDAKRTGREPVICSEFGNWGLPDPAALKGPDGAEPWWFETGHDWGEGVMYPHGVEQRFHAFGLDSVFGSLRGFVEAAQWQQFRALKYQIEAMRLQPEIAGYVITELTDCHWEANGLLDMRRNPRVFHDRFATVNADTVVLPEWRKLAYWAGESVEIGLAAAHGRGDTVPEARLGWRLDAAGAKGSAALDLRPGVQRAGTAAFRAPATPGVHRLELELTAPGARLATNSVDLFVHARRDGPLAGAVSVFAQDAALGDRMLALGYRQARSAATADVILARTPEKELVSACRDGGRLVLLADQPFDLDPLFPHWQQVRVVRRHGTMWLGCWASSFSWLRRTGPFARLPGGPLLDHGFERVIPDHVITGLNGWSFRGCALAGMVVGWVHKPAALLVDQPYGRGRVVATTFRLLEDAPGVDPTATALLDGLVEQALAGARRVEPEIELAPAA